MINRDAMPPAPARMLPVSVLAAMCAIICHAASAQPSQNLVVHDELVVTLDPANHHLKVRDSIHVPGALVAAPFTVSLNGDLKLQPIPGGLKLLPIGPRAQGSDSGLNRDDRDSASSIPVAIYGVEGATPGQELTGELNYEGTINYTAANMRGRSANPPA